MKRFACAFLGFLVFLVVPVYAQEPRITVGITSYSDISLDSLEPHASYEYDPELDLGYFLNELNEDELPELLEDREYGYDQSSDYDLIENLPFDPVAFWNIFHSATPNEVTFDTRRTITGTAPYRTFVTAYVITTYENQDGDISFAIYATRVIVGSSMVFSLELPLEEGDNIVVIKFFNEYEGVDNAIASQIRRMSQNIRQELENFVPSLPGFAQEPDWET
ncbi:MAG: hypothetical protein FWG63_09435 [Defluviitaleaceae bacterium]|nr:hypothetical protein [Defluviitaleaceae bacterium]